MKQILWIVLITLVACGDSESTTGPGGLNTTPRSEPGWQAELVELSNVSWRLIDMDGRFATIRNAARVSYNMAWTNKDPSRTVDIGYELHFNDANGFELAKIWAGNVVLTGGSSQQVTGTVSLVDVITVSLANQITEMEVWTSFIYP